MSFSPLPDAFQTDLRSSSTGLTVELGCGDGRFTRILDAAGARGGMSDRIRSDVFAPGHGVLADAAAPPFREVTLMVAANLLRHLWDKLGRSSPTDAWIDCLAAGGCLYIFEDEPAEQPGPARNYRDLQELLAQIVPWRKGLLAKREFERFAANGVRPGAWTFGLTKNQFSPAGRHDVLSLLVDERGVIANDAAALVRKVAEEGIDYGHYWWARYEREWI
ncbi:hypothetical protein KKA85_06280 [bacterium]|nr:hypothetical protein [bacterium]